jgi:PAS domain S-box-containing protein
MKHRILYIDDTADHLLLMKEMIGSEYKIYCTDKIQEAFELLEKKKFAVIISDFTMPQMTGLEFFAKVNENHPHISKILLTAYSNIDLAVRAFTEATVFDYLTKPVDFDKLQKTLFRACEVSLLKIKADKKKKAAHELQVSLNAVFENSPIILMLVSYDGTVKKANKKGLDFIEQETLCEGILGSVLRCINSFKSACGTNPECGQCTLRKSFEQTIAAQQAIIGKETAMTFLINNKLENRNFLITTNQVLFQKENVVQVSIIDITENKKQAKALASSENRYQMLFEHMDSAFALHEIITKDGIAENYRFLEVNPAFERLTKLKKTEILGKTVLDVIPNLAKPWLERYGKIALNGEAVLFDDYNKELGKYFEVSAYSPEPNLFATLFTDITERKIVEKTLKFTSVQTIFPKYNSFYEEVVLFLGSLLSVEFAMITLISSDRERVRTIAYSENGIISPNFSYKLENTPCEEVYKNKQAFYSSNLKARYPNISFCKVHDAESFAGFELVNSKGEVLGHIAVFGKNAIPNPETVLKVLSLSAVRVGFEIELQAYLNEKQSLLENLKEMVESRDREIYLRIKTEKAMLKAVQATEEKERSIFAREMHDGIGPQLSIANMYLNVLLNADKDTDNSEIIKKTISLLEGSVRSVVEISHAMSPNILKKNGLSYAIYSFCTKIEHKNSPRFTLNLVPDIRFKYDIEFSLYRICTELINNSLKYSKAKNIKIDLTIPANQIIFTYTDDGEGFDFKKTISSQKGMGLENIQNRATALGGHINFTSAVGKGVYCNIIISQNQ